MLRSLGAVLWSKCVLKILGVTLDSTLTFDDHINNVMRSCNYHLRALRHLRPCLSLDVASIAGSRLDYCNALYYGVTQSTMNKLQRVQNNLARVVCDVYWRQAHSADLLHDLPWLLVRKRVMFKAASRCYRSCKFGQPAYLPLASYIAARHLRSSNSDWLNEVPARIAIAEQHFSHYAPCIWNSLPTTVRSADSYDCFKARLKTPLSDSPTITTASRPG